MASPSRAQKEAAAAIEKLWHEAEGEIRCIEPGKI